MKTAGKKTSDARAQSGAPLPPWLPPGLESAAPAPATLVAGADGDGAAWFAERLTIKFATGGAAWNPENPIPLNSPDILAVRPDLPKSKPEDEKTHYGVESVRGGEEEADDSAAPGARKPRRIGLVEFAGMRPKALPFRAVLIRRADRMNPQAANALLKTLEEPGRATRFVLTAPAARLLLPTVASRCRVLQSPRPSAEQAAAWVRQAGRDAADLAFFGGRPLDAAGEDAKTRDLRRATAGLFRAGKDLDLGAAAKILSTVPAAEWLDWLQKWTSDAARAAMNLRPRFFPGDAEILSRLAAGRSRSFLDLHAALVRRRIPPQALNATLLVMDALEDYRRAAGGRFAADFSLWEFQESGLR